MNYYVTKINDNGNIAVDDTILVKDVQSAAGSRMLEGFKPLFSAEAVVRLENAGYGKEFCHSLGHGVGLQVHEAPYARSKSEEVLLSGMTLTIEPGIYIPDYCGVRIEDLVVVEDGGYTNLTFSAKKLIEL